MNKFQKILMGVFATLILLLGASTAYSINLLRQTQHDLSLAQNIIEAKETNLQELNQELAISKSSLVSAEELNYKYKDELSKLHKDFQKMLAKYNLELDSRDNLIAELKGKVSGGATTVVVNESADQKSIQYTWNSDDKRFKLIDPDIFIQNNESFEYQQNFEVTGLIYKDETGTLKVRKLLLSEVKLNSDGTTTPIPGAKIRLVNSTFEYVPPVAKPKLLSDVLHPRVFSSFDTQLFPGIGIEFLNMGRFIDYLNLGLTTKVAFNLNDFPNNLKASTLGVGITYTLLPPIFNSNIGVGVNIQTPMDNLLDRYILTLDAIFYLTN